MILTMCYRCARWLTTLVLLFVISSCASTSVADMSERDGVDAIEQLHHNAQWSQVIDVTDVFRTRYPYSSDMAKIDLLQADAYFQSGRYPEAIAAYGDFIRRNPSHPQVTLARYRMAEGYDKQSPEDIDRDQSSTTQAVTAYKLFVKTYPRSPWVEEASQRLVVLNRRLLDHNMFIAYFYWEKSLYAAALPRYLEIVQNPNYAKTAPDIYQQARSQATSCYEELAKELEKDPGSEEYAVFLNETPASLREKGARL